MLFGEEYDLAREYRACTRSIADGSIEQQMVADNRERGLSYTETALVINRFCLQNDRPTVTRSGVVTCEQHMVHMINNIEKRPTGNKDVGSRWATARHRFSAQTCVPPQRDL